MLAKDYVLGLVDGEGSFTVQISKREKGSLVRKRRARAEPKFYLKLIETDKSILYELKNFFGCGNVYFQKDIRKNHQNCYRFEVTRRDDLERKIIPFFRGSNPKLSSKIKDFKIFCELFKRIKNGEHLTQRGLNNLLSIKQKMH
ncbi:MAG: Uncharacterized protein Athens071426_395 [Parcubacteria group bacterium Athens0714_26]|nr:MAG: Uncharacterized protein Athens071426_395 [Parcubacteria group bacterium Athens0714_26]